MRDVSEKQSLAILCGDLHHADADSASSLRPSSKDGTLRPASSSFHRTSSVSSLPHSPPVGRDQEGRIKWAGIFTPSHLLAAPRSPSSISPASAREYASASNNQPFVPAAAPAGRLVDEDDTSRPSSAIGLGGLLDMIRSRMSRSHMGPSSASGGNDTDAAICVDASLGTRGPGMIQQCPFYGVQPNSYRHQACY